MLNLSKINEATNTIEKSRKARKSIQSDFIAHCVSNNIKTMTAPEVLSYVQNYTLNDVNQKWYDTEAKFKAFSNDVEKVNNNKLTVKQFTNKHNVFLSAMNTKTYDLFFSPKHKRSFVNNDKFKDLVSVDIAHQVVTIK